MITTNHYTQIFRIAEVRNHFVTKMMLDYFPQMDINVLAHCVEYLKSEQKVHVPLTFGVNSHLGKTSLSATISMYSAYEGYSVCYVPNHMKQARDMFWHILGADLWRNSTVPVGKGRIYIADEYKAKYLQLRDADLFVFDDLENGNAYSNIACHSNKTIGFSFLGKPVSAFMPTHLRRG